MRNLEYWIRICQKSHNMYSHKSQLHFMCGSNLYETDVKIRKDWEDLFCRNFRPKWKCYTPARTHSISGLKSRVLKLTFLALKMIVKSGLEFILKFTEPLQRYLLTCQANSAFLGRFFCTGQQQLWRGSVKFKIIFPRPLFTITFKPKKSISWLEILVYL